MTCRCLTKEEHARRAVESATYASNQQAKANDQRIRELEARTPNPDDFTVEDSEQVGRNLVLKLRYPGCAKCDFDRCKVMVYLGVSVREAIRWLRADPHFKASAAQPKPGSREAPSPAARFPASPEGWTDAVEYARRKSTPP